MYMKWLHNMVWIFIFSQNFKSKFVISKLHCSMNNTMLCLTILQNMRSCRCSDHCTLPPNRRETLGSLWTGRINSSVRLCRLHSGLLWHTCKISHQMYRTNYTSPWRDRSKIIPWKYSTCTNNQWNKLLCLIEIHGTIFDIKVHVYVGMKFS